MNKTATTIEQKDYTKYGYRSTDSVTITGDLFNETMSLLTMMEPEERKVFYESKETASELFSQEPLVFLTPKGMALTDLIGKFLKLHEMNVDLGLATHIDVLSQPQMSEVTPKTN